MRASLPMYDLPEIRVRTDRLWAAIAEEMRGLGMPEVPDTLERPADHRDAWRPPGLLLSQSCGYPVATALRRAVRVVATPHYAATGCDGLRYRSAIVARASSRMTILDDLRGTVCAFSARDSQSGYNALRAAVAPVANGRPFFSATIGTGSHALSIDAVRRERADVCAVDCVTWALLSRYRPPSLSGLVVLAHTEPAPGLPFVTAGCCSDAAVETIRDALDRAFSRPDLAETRAALLLGGVSASSLETYEPLLEMERAAVALGYPDLE